MPRAASVLLALTAAAWLSLIAPPQARACSYAPIPLADVVNGRGSASSKPGVDTVALVTVLSRQGLGPWRYTLRVDELYGGDPVGDRWALRAGASACGMPRLSPGLQYVLEYWRPESREVPYSWYFAWTVLAGGRIEDASGHLEQPPTLRRLVALYRAAGLSMPDTATSSSPVLPMAAQGAEAPIRELLLSLAGILGIAAWLRSMSRRLTCRLQMGCDLRG